MNLAYIDYTFKQKALDIYVCGCNPPHCPGCHNPELWPFNVGEYWENKKKIIESYVNRFDKWVDNFMIFGGEPMDQNKNSLQNFLFWLKSFSKQIWVFTGYDFEELNKENLKYIDFLKCGRYKKELVTEDNLQYGLTLATSNQHIYKLK